MTYGALRSWMILNLYFWMIIMEVGLYWQLGLWMWLVVVVLTLKIPHSTKCLSYEESWKLLCSEMFVGKPCSLDLIEIWKGIAKKCQGLPLPIAVVAGHLSKVPLSQNCWADVANRLDSVITGDQERILDILCLSYNSLPHNLKACFLYWGFFSKELWDPCSEVD